MTTANKVTILRILLVPFFAVEVMYYMKNGHESHRLLAIIAFGVAALCDGLDGFIARRFNQRSELGAILDPLADKLLLLTGIILFSFENRHLGNMPLWPTVTIIGRDLLLLVGLVVIQMTVGKVQVRPRALGKIATVLQMICIIWLLLKLDARLPQLWFWIWTSTGISTGVSGLLYVLDGMKQLSSHPTSSATTTSAPTDKPTTTRD